MAERIGLSDFEEKVLKEEKTVLVDFYSDSCIPCKKMTGVLAKVEQEIEGQARIYKVNTNYEKDLVEKYEVQSVPTFLIFKAGEIIERLTGVQKKEVFVEKLK